MARYEKPLFGPHDSFSDNGHVRVYVYFIHFRNTLGKQLFIGNEVLQGCLIHVRSLCEAASGSLTGEGQGESAVSLIKLDKSVTLTLQEFKDVQRKQNEIALKQLNALRDKIIEIAWESCAVSLLISAPDKKE